LKRLIFLCILLFISSSFTQTLVQRDGSGLYIPAENEVELVDGRTRSFKQFKIGDSGKRRIIGQVGPIHYKVDPFSESEQYKEIDLTISLTPLENWDAACETNGYQVRFWQSREISGKTIRYIAQYRRANRWIGMAPLALMWVNEANQKQLISATQAVGAPTIDNNSYTVTWEDVFGNGIHFRYNLKPDEFFKTLVIDDKTDLPTPTIPVSGLKLVLVIALSWHGQAEVGNGFASGITTSDLSEITNIDAFDEQLNNSEKFNFRDELLRNVWWMQKPRAWDSADSTHYIDVDWQIRRVGTYIFGLFSVPATALNHSATVYPVYMDADITEEQVGASADDGHTWGDPHPGDDQNLTYAYQANVGASTSNFYTWGYRFQTVPVDASTNFDKAVLVVNAPSNSGTLDITIWGEDVDDAAEFSSGHTIYGDAWGAKTTASVQWIPTESWSWDVWYESPNIKSIIDEITGRGGWASNQDMIFLIANTETSLPASNEYRSFVQWDSDSDDATKLQIITYTSGDFIEAIDAVEFNTNQVNYLARIERCGVTGNYYAVPYMDSGNDLNLATFECNTTGEMAAALTEEWEVHASTYMLYHGMDAVWRQGENILIIASVEVNAELDVRTIEIDTTDGDITATGVLDIQDFVNGSSTTQFLRVFHVGGIYYGIIYENSSNLGVLETFSVATDGTIAKVDSWTFEAGELNGWTDVVRLGSSDYFLLAYRTSGNDLEVKTTEIDVSDGSCDGNVDSLVVDSGNVTEYCALTKAGDDMYVVHYKEYITDTDLVIATFEADDSDGSIGSSVTDSWDTEANYTPMPEGVYCIEDTIHCFADNAGNFAAYVISAAGTITESILSEGSTVAFSNANSDNIYIGKTDDIHYFITVGRIDADADGWAYSYSVMGTAGATGWSHSIHGVSSPASVIKVENIQSVLGVE